jgi:hypothetical protein
MKLEDVLAEHAEFLAANNGLERRPLGIFRALLEPPTGISTVGERALAEAMEKSEHEQFGGIPNHEK